jgi:pimeloyl-ACP methyl ester carboxylesterase
LDFQLKEGITGMPTLTTKDGVEIFYKDWGKGQPIVFSHGWPLSAGPFYGYNRPGVKSSVDKYFSAKPGEGD